MRDLCEIGVRYVSDIIDHNGEAITFDSLVNKGLSKAKWLRWQNLVHAVKIYWRQNQPQPIASHIVLTDNAGNFCVKNIDIEHCTSKYVYSHIKGSNDVHVSKIEKYLYVETEKDWQQIYTRPRRLIQDVKTQEFQYRFLHDILVNNHWLYKWKVKDSDKCRWCYEKTENLSHIFWECPFAVNFWYEFKEFIAGKTNTKVDVHSVFFGCEEALLCSLIFIAKQYLYKCLYDEKVPWFSECYVRIIYVKQMENEIAKKAGKLDKWENKWSALNENDQ